MSQYRSRSGDLELQEPICSLRSPGGCPNTVQDLAILNYRGHLCSWRSPDRKQLSTANRKKNVGRGPVPRQPSTHRTQSRPGGLPYKTQSRLFSPVGAVYNRATKEARLQSAPTQHNTGSAVYNRASNSIFTAVDAAYNRATKEARLKSAPT